MANTVTIEKQVWESTLKASMDRAGRIEILERQLVIAKKYLSLIKCNVSIGSLAYTYCENAKTEIKELDKKC